MDSTDASTLSAVAGDLWRPAALLLSLECVSQGIGATPQQQSLRGYVACVEEL